MNYLRLLLLVVVVYYSVNNAEHNAHKHAYLMHGQTSFVQCDKCAIEISETILNKTN